MKYFLFKEISKTCNYILKKKINYFKVSLTSLHIIRSHKSYFNLLNRKSNNNKFFLKLLKKYFSVSYNYSQKKESGDYLFISNFVNKSELNRKDRFFNQIIDQLESKKKKYNIIYRNLGFSNKNIRSSKKNMFILYETSNIFRDIYYLLKISLEMIKVFFYKEKNNFKIKKKIINNLITFKNLTSSLSNINHVESLMNLIKMLNPKIVFITYEGYPWERMLCKKLKEYNPNIKIFGYYFSVIPKYINTPLIKFKKNFDPDFILTSSKFVLDVFKKNGFEKKKIFNIGIKKNKQLFSKFQTKSRFINCLILPESFDDEIKYLINFAKQIDDLKIGIKFILRLHPSIQENFYINQIKLYIDKSNIELSKNSLSEDIKRSHLAFYRGSSSIIEVSSYDVVPIFISKKNELSTDILYKLEKIKPKIDSPKDFVNFFKTYKKNNFKIFKTNKVKIVNFCKTYYSPINKKIINQVINIKKN